MAGRRHVRRRGRRPRHHARDGRSELAGYGYAVLLPDVYYRHGDWEPFDMRTVFGDPEQRTRLMAMVGSVTPDMIAATRARSSTSSILGPR